MTGTTASESVVLQRELPQTRDRVFDWLTEPDKLARWMTPQGRVEVEADARPGGRLSVVMIGEGIRIEHSGHFVEVDRPRRIVFTWNSPFTAGDSLVTIELEARGEGTALTLRHERLPDGQAESHGGGWSAMLGRLAAELGNLTLEV